jgi:hypothetical protein
MKKLIGGVIVLGLLFVCSADAQAGWPCQVGPVSRSYGPPSWQPSPMSFGMGRTFCGPCQSTGYNRVCGPSGYTRIGAPYGYSHTRQPCDYNSVCEPCCKVVETTSPDQLRGEVIQLRDEVTDLKKRVHELEGKLP